MVLDLSICFAIFLYIYTNFMHNVYYARTLETYFKNFSTQKINNTSVFSFRIFISNLCAAFGLVVKQISSAVFSSWWKIIIVIIEHTEFAMVNHFLIAFHIGCFSCVFHMFREVCTFIMIEQTIFIPVGDMLKC